MAQRLCPGVASRTSIRPPEPPLSLVNSLSRAGMRLAVAPVRVAGALRDGGAAAQRQATAALRDTRTRALQTTFDATLERFFAGPAIDRVLEHVETARLAQRIADRMLADGIAEQVAQRAIAGPELERVVARALESRLPEVVVSSLLESQALWVLVDEIARSPSVTEAITRQGTGFVEQVAGVARDRSRDADDWVERFAHRFARRHPDAARRAGLEMSARAPTRGEHAP